MLSVEKFLEIEKKYNLYEDTIDGINYWIYARYQVWESLLKSKQPELGESHSFASKNVYQRLKIYKNLFLRAIFRRKIKETDICFLAHPRRVYENGIYKCKYTESIAQEFSNRYVLEYPYQMEHFTPVKTQNLIYLDRVQIKSVLLYLIYKDVLKYKYSRLEEEVKKKTIFVFHEMEKEFNVTLNIENNIQFIVAQIIYYKASKSDLEHIIDKLRPNIFIEVVGYDLTCMMINEICKKRKIPTVELQHGTLHEIAYRYNTEHEIKQIPDYIFLFSEFWKNYVEIPILKNKLVAVGFPYFESQTKCVKKIEEYCDEKCNIIFLSQGWIGKKLSRLAYELVQKIDMSQYRIFFKLHPGECEIWKKEYVDLNDDRIVVIDNQNYTLYEYFATSKIQVGVSSTALYEGLGFKLRTYIYHIETSEEYAGYLCDEGFAKYVENCEDLLERILNERDEKQNIKNIWKDNSLNNMKQTICKIVGEEKGIRI